MNILVTTSPFGKDNDMPIKILEESDNFKINYNTTNHKYSKDELMVLLKNYNPKGIIAGTENYDSEVLDCCPNLKVISRVGIGLDSIDLEECNKRNIIVKNTPDAPTNAVAEITIGQIINLLRRIQEADKNMRKKNWERFSGKEIKNCTIGIIGCGRIGSSVYKKISAFNPKKIYLNDIIPEKAKILSEESFVKKEDLIKKSDIITLHIPLNKENKNYFSKKEFDLMREESVLLNFSRGGIVNETDLYFWLLKNPKSIAAIDTFETEPYTGNLLELNNCYFTPHMGSCSKQSRFDMEVGAVNNLLEVFDNMENFKKTQ